MQPLQRSYAITEKRIKDLLSSGILSNLYDHAKVIELENIDELTGKDVKKLEKYLENKPLYEDIINTLEENISDNLYLEPKSFTKHIKQVLLYVTTDKKIITKICHGLSKMDKSAEIQKDKNGEIIYDKETKDVEIVKFEENIDDYMVREVLPHIPDAKAFFEENYLLKNL